MKRNTGGLTLPGFHTNHESTQQTLGVEADSPVQEGGEPTGKPSQLWSAGRAAPSQLTAPGKLGIPRQKVKLDAHLMPHTKLSSKWIETLNLNVGPGTLKLKRKCTEKLQDTGFGGGFLNATPKAQGTRVRRQTELHKNF